MLLDKKSKIIIDMLISHGYTAPKISFVSIRDSLLPILPKPEKYKWERDLLYTNLSYLNELGLVDYVQHANGYYPVPECSHLFVTHKGLAYKELSRLELKSFLLRSILTPIVVSAATSFVVSLLSRL